MKSETKKRTTASPREDAWAAGKVVWQEPTKPFQWIGMCPRHRGGIRTNSSAEATKFMEQLCGRIHPETVTTS